MVGLLWSLPRPESFINVPPLFNWGTLFVAVAMIYYFILSWRLALGMLLVSALVIWGNSLDQLPTPLWQIALAIFGIAWVGQFIGHKIEGRKPPFFRDVSGDWPDPAVGIRLQKIRKIILDRLQTGAVA